MTVTVCFEDICIWWWCGCSQTYFVVPSFLGWVVGGSTKGKMQAHLGFNQLGTSSKAEKQVDVIVWPF